MFLDLALSMEALISAVAKSVFNQLQMISPAVPLPGKEIPINSGSGFCNLRNKLLYWFLHRAALGTTVVWKLQQVQNVAARFIAGINRY